MCSASAQSLENGKRSMEDSHTVIIAVTAITTAVGMVFVLIWGTFPPQGERNKGKIYSEGIPFINAHLGFKTMRPFVKD